MKHSRHAAGAAGYGSAERESAQHYHHPHQHLRGYHAPSSSRPPSSGAPSSSSFGAEQTEPGSAGGGGGGAYGLGFGVGSRAGPAGRLVAGRQMLGKHDDDEGLAHPLTKVRRARARSLARTHARTHTPLGARPR